MSDARTTKTWIESGWLSAKVEKVVRIVLYGLVIGQPDHRKTGPYQFPFNSMLLLTELEVHTKNYCIVRDLIG